MSRISDVSSKLGEYMLRGYVLTDEGCPLCSIPMLRPPSGQSVQRLFCSQCQTPDASRSSALGSRVGNVDPNPPSPASGSSTEISRVSTPPTEVSSTLSSPTFAPPPDPQEMMRRRAQSDLASAEIGKRMLRGWAMLAEECPSESCYGVPLVRPPKPGGGKDPRKECVICGHVYVYALDTHGMERLASLQIAEHSQTPATPHNLSSLIDTTPVVEFAPAVTTRNHGGDQTSQVETAPPQSFTLPSATIPILNESIRSLEQSLHVLSARLVSMSRQIPLHHIAIGEVAHSVEQVTSALRTVKHLHFQESTGHAN